MKIFALLALATLPAFAQAGGKGKTEVTWYGHAAFVVKTRAARRWPSTRGSTTP